MIVYHGSTEIIKNPDVVHSKKYLDFGRGFYITTFENQAKKWAVRKGMRQEKNAIVNVYELSEEWDDFTVLSFEKENEKWLDFVCACRKGQPINKEYDIPVESDIEEGVSIMCNLSQGIEEKALEKGRSAGIAQGKTSAQIDIILNMYNNNFTIEQIALATQYDVDKIKEIIQKN